MPGWEDRGLGQVAGTSSIGLDLQAFDTPEELESIGEGMHLRLSGGGRPVKLVMQPWHVVCWGARAEDLCYLKGICRDGSFNA